MEQTLRIIQRTATLQGLAQIHKNAASKALLTPELRAALDTRAGELGRDYLRTRAGISLTDLSPAEEKIVRAISTYVGIKVREGSNANRTIDAVRHHGLIGAAEVAVDKATPTMGFDTLSAAGLSDLSYERIIIDHPEEFSARSLWHARRTLGLRNTSPKAPSKSGTPIQEQTDRLLGWLKARRDNDRRISTFTNLEAATGLGWDDLQVFGRAYGNLQSRLDFACYRAGLPPLGLTAAKPFEKAWGRDNRDWAFPVAQMQAAAQSRSWSDSDFAVVSRKARALPGHAHVMWQEELTLSEANVRAWAEGLGSDAARDESSHDLEKLDTGSRRNPAWSREELVLALDLYWILKGSPFGKDDDRIQELSSVLAALAASQGVLGEGDFRNPNGVYMKLMNLRALDPDFAAEGKVGLTRGGQLERVVWDEFADDRVALAEAAEAIRESIRIPLSSQGETAYWVFVCNPKKWAIDQFLATGANRDTWGVRPADRERFAPGQLGLVRVGVDRRNATERGGHPALSPGIYALVEIESEAYGGTGASDAFWAAGAERASGWPAVNVKYLASFVDQPLGIGQLREAAPNLSHLLLNGFQAASFPIPERDFRQVLDLLNVSLETLIVDRLDSVATPDELDNLEARYRNACPEVKERVSRWIERGPVGALVKKLNGYRCQICEALGYEAIGFRTRSGQPYVEAHHVMPVSKGQVGSLGASNILTACPNHHRQLHYGSVKVEITDHSFEITLDGHQVSTPRLLLGRLSEAADQSGVFVR